MPRIVTIHDVAAFFGVDVDVVTAWRQRQLDDRLMSTAEVAALVGVGVDTLEKWRAAGDGPPWRKLGRTAGGRGSRARTVPRYKRAEVLAWIESKRQAGGAC
jgi:predicted DNA-binding transcriptional regulator AlpA